MIYKLGILVSLMGLMYLTFVQSGYDEELARVWARVRVQKERADDLTLKTDFLTEVVCRAGACIK